MVKRLWRDAPYLTVGLGLSLLVAAVFAVRLMLGVLYWSDPRHQDMPIAPWMSPRFVALSWDVPPEVVREALDLTREEARPGPLKELASRRGVPVDVLIRDLEASITRHRAAEP